MTPQHVYGGVVLWSLAAVWAVWILMGSVRLVAAIRAATRRQRVLWSGLFLIALGLRLLAPAVEHDLNPRIAEVFAGYEQLEWRYTHGLVALMRVVWLLGAWVDDLLVFHLVAVTGALSVPLLYVATRQLGGGRLAAVCATVVLGGLGLHVRYSHTDAPQVVEILLTLLAVVSVLSVRGPPDRRDVLWTGINLGLLAVMRPEGALIAAWLGLWFAAVKVDWPAQATLFSAGLAALIVAPDLLGVVLINGGESAAGINYAEGHAVLLYGLQHWVVWNRAFVPPMLGLLIFLAPWGRAGPRRAIATLTLMLALGLIVENRFWSIGYLPSWCLARHQLRLLPWMALAMGLGVESLVDLVARRASPQITRCFHVTAALSVAGMTATTLPDAYARFTLSDEYTFVRTHLRDVPAHCTIRALDDAADQGLNLVAGLPHIVVPHTWEPLSSSAAPGPCLVYYRSPTCTLQRPNRPDGDRCAAFEAQWKLEPIAETEVVTRPWLWERYATPTLRIGYYRVLGPR